MDDDWTQTYTELGYIYCRICQEWHRPPECYIEGEAVLTSYQQRPWLRQMTWTFDPDTGAGILEAVVEQGDQMFQQRWEGLVAFGPDLEVEEIVPHICPLPHLINRLPSSLREFHLNFRVDLEGAQSSTQTISTFSD